MDEHVSREVLLGFFMFQELKNNVFLSVLPGKGRSSNEGRNMREQTEARPGERERAVLPLTASKLMSENACEHLVTRVLVIFTAVTHQN
jgi:hypothetical protein